MYRYYVNYASNLEFIIWGRDEIIWCNRIGGIVDEFMKLKQFDPLRDIETCDFPKGYETFKRILSEHCTETNRIAFYRTEFILSDNASTSYLQYLNINLVKFIRSLYHQYRSKDYSFADEQPVLFLHSFDKYWRTHIKALCKECNCFCYTGFEENFSRLIKRFSFDSNGKLVASGRLVAPQKEDPLFLLKEFTYDESQLYIALHDNIITNLSKDKGELYVKKYNDYRKKVLRFQSNKPQNDFSLFIDASKDFWADPKNKGAEFYDTSNDLIMQRIHGNKYHSDFPNYSYWKTIYTATNYFIEAFGYDMGKKISMLLMLLNPFSNKLIHPFWDKVDLIHTLDDFCKDYFEYEQASSILRECIEYTNIINQFAPGSDCYTASSIREIIEISIAICQSDNNEIRKCAICDKIFLRRKTRQIYCCDECAQLAKQKNDNAPSIQRTCKILKQNRTKLKNRLSEELKSTNIISEVKRLNHILNYIYLSNNTETNESGLNLVDVLEPYHLSLEAKEKIAKKVYQTKLHKFNSENSLSIPVWSAMKSTVSVKNKNVTWNYLYEHSEPEEKHIINGYLMSLKGCSLPLPNDINTIIESLSVNQLQKFTKSR